MVLRKSIVAFLLVANIFAANAALAIRGAHGQITATSIVRAPTDGFDSSYHLSLRRPVQDKNFYLLSLFQRNRGVRLLLRRNKVLNQVATEKHLALKKIAGCNTTACFDELMRFDAATTDAVATALQTLSGKPAVTSLAKSDLRPSGVFIKYSRQSDAEMLVAAWKDAAAGLNRILDVYGLGKDPRYSAIDKVSFDVSTESYRDLVKAKMAEINLETQPLFFEPTLNFALKLLEINRRDEAGRYEPLAQGENRAAVESLRNIHWSDYPYAFILVLGSGPSDSARLSSIGAKRADVGAELFLQHKAPLLILSGGHVHPLQTPYSEAIEMKKYVMEKYQIPEANILVDPHARHTTTNFRNAARLAFRYGIPTALALVTSSESHIASTINDQFRTRCVNELGYFPIEFIRGISPIAAEFKPSVTSLFFDANDPLDP